MQVTYPGPLPAVLIDATGQTVARGEQVDVPDDIGRSLLAQGWPQVDTASTKAGSKSADDITTEEV